MLFAKYPAHMHAFFGAFPTPTTASFANEPSNSLEPDDLKMLTRYRNLLHRVLDRFFELSRDTSPSNFLTDSFAMSLEALQSCEILFEYSLS